MKWEEDEEGHGEKKRKRRLVAKALRSLLMCNEFQFKSDFFGPHIQGKHSENDRSESGV